MIDWHSHILPRMDDGSRSVEESLAMLEMMSGQGVSVVIATPHFYANADTLERFLKRRSASLEALTSHLTGDHPRILCGAEVRYYPGIAKFKELPTLAIEGTGLLLLEMPSEHWTEYTVNELIELSSTSGLTIVLAHIERYLPMQSIKVFERLRDNGILMQVNASFFKRFSSRRKALKMLDSGLIHFLGSDTHNLTDRVPNLGTAYQIIEAKFGNYYVVQMNGYGYRQLGHFN